MVLNPEKKNYYYALTVLGKDRVGIIKKISSFLAEHKINIDDSSMTRLRNEFAMILLLASRKILNKNFLKKIKSVSKNYRLEFFLKPLKREELMTRRVNKNERLISIKVYGADRTGIVAKVSSVLASHKINIIDMRTRHIGNPDDIFKKLTDRDNSHSVRGVYILTIEALLPVTPEVDFISLKKSLLKAAQSIKCHLSIDEYQTEEL